MGADVASAHVAFQYKAFISYSRRDETWAERLQSELENFHIRQDLRGMPSTLGPEAVVPETLCPIFRDRSDMSAAPSLTEALRSALSRSEFLIVVCSPSAVKSQYVNEEIRFFGDLGRREKILAIVVDVAPGSPVSSSFPPALVECTAPHKPYGPDARNCGEGWKYAHLKLVSRLLGLPFRKVSQGRERGLKERQRLYAVGATLSVAAMSTVVAGYLWFKAAHGKGVETDIWITAHTASTKALIGEINSMGVHVSAAIKSLEAALQGLDALGPSERADPKIRILRAKMGLQIARAKGNSLQIEGQMDAVRRALYEIEGLKGHTEISEAMLLLRAEAHRLSGKVHFSRDNLKEALEEFDKGLEILAKAGDHFVEHDMRMSPLGPDDYAIRGRLNLEKAGALARFGKEEKEKALALGDWCIRWGVKLPTDNVEVAEVLLDAIYLAADLRRQTNDPGQAHQADIDIDEGFSRLRTMAPGRSRDWRAANLYLARGDLRRALNNRPGSLDAFQEASSHLKRLTDKDPSDLLLNDHYAFSLIKTGESLNANGKPAEAIGEFKKAQDLYKKLSERSTRNLRYPHWRWTANQGLAEAYRLGAQPDKEIEYHREKLRIAKANASLAPDYVDFLLDLAGSHRDLGVTLVARGGAKEGMENLSQALRLLDPLVKRPNADPRFGHLRKKALESIPTMARTP